MHKLISKKQQFMRKTVYIFKDNKCNPINAMHIKYFLTPNKSADDCSTEGSGTPCVTGSNGESHMISYLCHIPGKLSFTVTATPAPQMKAGK